MKNPSISALTKHMLLSVTTVSGIPNYVNSVLSSLITAAEVAFGVQIPFLMSNNEDKYHLSLYRSSVIEV